MAATATNTYTLYQPINNNTTKLLHSSVAKGHLRLVQKLISNDGCDPNIPLSTTGLRPIHFAASRGHLQLVQFLVDHCHVEIDAIDKEGETALLKAAYAGHETVLKYLHEQGHANYLHSDLDGWTALHNACSCGNVTMVNYLLNLPLVNVNIQSKQGHTSLSKLSLYF
jgi:ankyrin repeat protein